MCRSAPAERSLLHNLAASQRLQTSHQTRGELLLIQPDYNPVQLLSPAGKLLRGGSTQHDAEVSNSSNHLHDYRWTIYTTLLCFFRQLMDWCFLARVHLPHACSKPTLSDWWEFKGDHGPKEYWSFLCWPTVNSLPPTLPQACSTWSCWTASQWPQPSDLACPGPSVGSLPTPRQIDISSQFGIICELTEGEQTTYSVF